MMKAKHVLSLCTTLLLINSVVAEPLIPPPLPKIQPVISESYSSDFDGDKIDDELQVQLEVGIRNLELAVKKEQSQEAVAALMETVDVELIFREQITQQQIDNFILLGGEINYIYKVVSYGWNGRIPLSVVSSLPSVMGSTLVQVDKPDVVRRCMDSATQTGRVRPIWTPGFAGNSLGFDGDPNITIGIIDTGADANHTDLAGRCVDWKDLSEQSLSPRDHNGHGSHVTAIAVGTGAAGGIDVSPLYYTYSYAGAMWMHEAGNISLPDSQCYFHSEAQWSGNYSGILALFKFLGGTDSSISSEIVDMNVVDLSSPIQLDSYMESTAGYLYVPVLLNPDNNLSKVVITNSITNYPGMGDGFNKFRGVAPACSWAGVRDEYDSGSSVSGGIGSGVDYLVDTRESKKIKVVNISSILTNYSGYPTTSTSLRNKVTNATKNGIVVVAAAGNNAYKSSETDRVMADPARAGLAITVGASNELNSVTDYSNYGFANPSSYYGEDYKPDLIAPGGSLSYYRGIVSVDSGTSDCYGIEDKEPNDYAIKQGTSMSAPFVAGCAGLVIDALQQRRQEEGMDPNQLWDFNSDNDPRFVKMVMCATATETNQYRENGLYKPILQRANPGPKGFPAGKDPNEGYGIVNPDAAVEAVYLDYQWGSEEIAAFGSKNNDRRAWARSITLAAEQMYKLSLTNPSTGDFDLYLYNAEPSPTGTPQILGTSTNEGLGVNETLHYWSQTDSNAILVVKRIYGDDQFNFFGNVESTVLTISGQVLSVDGSTISGVLLVPSGIAATDLYLTDSSGSYSITVPYGWTGEITPSNTLYEFTPLSYLYTNITDNQTAQDFTADYFNLSKDVPIAFSTVPKRFNFEILQNSWCCVGIAPATTDFDIKVSDNWQFSSSYASSTYSGTTRDFIVANGRRRGEQGNYAEVYDGSGSYTIEAEWDVNDLSLESLASGSIANNEVLDMYEVTLTSGKRYFLTLDIADGEADLAVFLFAPTRSSGYRGSNDGSVDSVGAGRDEYLIFTANASGEYGIVITNENAKSCSYTVELRQLD